MDDKINTAVDRISDQDDRISRLATSVDNLIAANTRTSADMVKTQSRPRTKEELANQTHTLVGTNSINAPLTYHISFQSAVPQAAMATDNSSTTRGPLGASNLLEWPEIKVFVPQHIKPSSVLDDGLGPDLLRFDIYDEGGDKADGHDDAPSPSLSSSSLRMDDISTLSPSEVGLIRQLPRWHLNMHAAHDHASGVTPDGELLLSKKIVDHNVQSYLERMHILHPFLDTRALRKMVQNFKFRYSVDSAIDPRLQPSAGSKRKRDESESPSPMTKGSSHHTVPHDNILKPPFRGPQSIGYSIPNAIVLLVIALGEICVYDKSLPRPLRVINLASVEKALRPFEGHADLPQWSTAPSSPLSVATHTNDITSGAAILHDQDKNVDAMPGSAYFVKAAHILGEFVGSVDVSYIQANLLAGLYMGQLLRVNPSHSYIANASKACQILISSVDYKEHKMTPERRNLINFAFWSCLQLESDILAEVDIPSSGIMSKESNMEGELPTTLTITDPKEDSSRLDIYRHYLCQIQLRRILNNAVNNLYNTNQDPGEHPTKLIDTISENLEMWRNKLNDWSWDDDDHESKDINHARLRAKYYGAKYIINRPALRNALSYSDSPNRSLCEQRSESPVSASHESEKSSFDSSPNIRRNKRMRTPCRVQKPKLDDWIVRASERCIRAAVKSTTAFDRVPGRLIVTDIFGTAHAQFGNVLCLAATFNSQNSRLSRPVKEDTLRTLLIRTIKFLDDKATISPALAKDATILRSIQFPIPPTC